MRPAVRFILIALCALTFLSLGPAAPRAQSWQTGIDPASRGRFGSWPENSATGEQFFCEDDLIQRVWPNRIERTVNNQFYQILYDCRTEPEVPASTWAVSVEDRNWVYKQIAVDRGPSLYRVAYSTVNPGWMVSTEEIGFSMQPVVGFGRCAYVAGVNPTVRNLETGLPPDGVFYRRGLHPLWRENWMLLWTGNSSPLGVQVPMLLVFSDQPDQIRWLNGRLYVKFYKTAGTTTDVYCVFLDGVGSRSLSEVAGWTPILPAAVTAKCRELRKSLLPYANNCTEQFATDEGANTVTIRDTFSYRPWSGDWNTSNLGIAPLPPLGSNARAHGYPVTCATEPTDLGIPTKIGPFVGRTGVTQAEYTIPLAPLWTPNLVPPVGGSVWTDRARSQVESWAGNLAWDLDDGDAFVPSVAKGNAEVLLGCQGKAADLYLSRCRNVLDDVVLDFSTNGQPWYHRVVPGTGQDYWYDIHFTNLPNFPADQDCGSAVPLEFLYNYALHSGDWSHLTSKWTEIQKIYKYLSIVSDWAWMSSACREYGAGGSFLDMFPSQWMGYVSFSKLARMKAAVTGEPQWNDVADRARYLASKAMIPLTQRFDFRDGWASQYYEFGANEVVSGFGEYEYNPHSWIPGFMCPDPTDNLLEDKTIAGENFHPQVYNVYQHLVPQQFDKYMMELYGANGGVNWSLQDTYYPYSKMYGLFLSSLNEADRQTVWTQLHTATDSWYEPVFGPYSLLHGDRYNGYIYGYQNSRTNPFWALGNWEPGIVTNAAFDPTTGALGFTLTNDGVVQQSVQVTVLARECPGSVTIDGVGATFTYDAAWQVATITVVGIGSHEIEVEPAGRKSDPAFASTRRVAAGHERGLESRFRGVWCRSELDPGVDHPRGVGLQLPQARVGGATHRRLLGEAASEPRCGRADLAAQLVHADRRDRGVRRVHREVLLQDPDSDSVQPHAAPVDPGAG